MSEIGKIVEQDLSNKRRCFFHGTTTLGGADACRPEIDMDGRIIMRSLNLPHVAYEVTEDEYLELRKHPRLKIGIWQFVDENDADASRIASATQSPESAGRRIGDLERKVFALEAENRDLRSGAYLASVVEERDAALAALKEVHTTLKTASRQLTEDHKMVLMGRAWGWKTLARIEGVIAKSEAKP